MFQNQCLLETLIKRVYTRSICVLLCLAVVSCGVGGDKKEEQVYLESKSVAPLQIPDDLNPIEQQRTYEIPELPATVANSSTKSPDELAKPPVFIDIGNEQDERETDEQPPEEITETNTGKSE